MAHLYGTYFFDHMWHLGYAYSVHEYKHARTRTHTHTCAYRFFGFTQEFGTRPGPLVGLATVLENREVQIGRRMGAGLAEFAFNPMRSSWRRLVLQGGKDVMNTLVAL